MAEFMFPNVAYRVTVYRTGHFLKLKTPELYLSAMQQHLHKVPWEFNFSLIKFNSVFSGSFGDK